MAKKRKSKQPSTTPPEHVSREDLRRGFQSLQDGVKGRVEEKRNTVVTVGVVAGVLVVLLVYVLGRRSGKAKTTVVEIRRL